MSVSSAIGMQFNGADGTYTFSGPVTMTGGAQVTLINNCNGSFNFTNSGTSISDPGGAAFSVNGGTGSIDYNGSISKTNNGVAIDIQNKTGGTVSFDGSVSATTAADGINLQNNTGATFAFTGGLTINSSASGTSGFNATGGGTISVTGGGNTIVAGTGTALNVANTTIGASGLTFHSISSSGASSGIVLNNTGTSGRLTVSGDGGGTNNGSGGTIQSSTGDGVSLTSTQDVHLGYMNIQNNLGDGIGGSGINGLVLTRLNISGNGNDAATDESGINITQLTGTASSGAHPTSISNSTITNNNEFELQITNSSGTLTNFQLIANTVSSNGLPINGNVTSPHGDLVNFLGLGTSAMGMTVTGGSFTGDWNPTTPPATITGTGIFANAGGTSMTVNVSGATFTNNNAGIDVSTDPVSTTLTFDLNNNTITGTRSTAINHFNNGNAPFTRTINGTIRNNVIGTSGVANSGSSVGVGIALQNEAAAAETIRIDNNIIQQIQQAPGINVNVGLGGQATGGGESDLAITNNTISNIGSRGIVIQDNQVTDIASPPGAGPFPTVWVTVSGNAFSTIAGQAGNGQYMRLKKSVRHVQGGAGQSDIVRHCQRARRREWDQRHHQVQSFGDDRQHSVRPGHAAVALDEPSAAARRRRRCDTRCGAPVCRARRELGPDAARARSRRAGSDEPLGQCGADSRADGRRAKSRLARADVGWPGNRRS